MNNNLLIDSIIKILGISALIWVMFIFPIYLTKIKKYDSEMDKALRMTKVWWFKIDPGYINFFINKINYQIIRSDIINYIYSNLSSVEQRQYEEMISISEYLEYIELREMQTHEKHEKIEAIERINIMYSIFLTQKRKDIYNDFFKPYIFNDEYYEGKVKKNWRSRTNV